MCQSSKGCETNQQRRKKMTNLDRVRLAIHEAFWWNFSEFEDSPEVTRGIEQATYTGEDDPGGWSPGAEVIVHCESGIPNGLYDGYIMDKWDSISDGLGDLYHEHVNGAVIAFYKV